MTTPSAHPLALTPGRAWALAAVATLTMAVSYVDRQTFSILAPRITEALHISEAGYAWLANGFSIAYLVCAPLAGRLIDRVGARRGLLGAVLAWSLVAALHAVAPGFAVLFALRVALGATESPSFPGAAQIVHRVLPPRDRARGFGLLFTGSSLGAAIAAPLATSIEHAYGFRVAFLVTTLIGLAWVPLWLGLAFSRDARAVLDHAPDAAGGPVPTAPGRGLADTLALVRSRAVVRAIAVIAGCAPLFAFGLIWGAKYLVRDHGLAPHAVGRYLWMPMVAFDLGAVLFGHLASVRHRRRNDGTPPRGLVLAAMVLGALLAATPLAGGPWLATVLISLALAGSGGLYALSTADMLARVPTGAVSTASGLAAAAQSLAIIIVNPIVAALVVASGSYTSALVALGAWAVPSCLVWLLVPAPPPTA